MPAAALSPVAPGGGAADGANEPAADLTDEMPDARLLEQRGLLHATAQSSLRAGAPAHVHAPETAQHVARQIAMALPQASDGSIELRLNPEELGRVRLALHPADGAMTVTITAERGETLDLMRRHAALLASEFRDIGYGDIRFDFGQSGQQQGDAPGDGSTPDDQHHAAGGTAHAAADIPRDAPGTPAATRAGSGAPGLDMRL